ncbi:endonuclease/exonuclease/phosphatase family protein [Bailinhaonella thermotolerans]|uniref:Endonuclease/exonuclease/phosphatase family protein n=1 Tax=Bailinhaonella thermotolerans TaxID=1070861 RepID=A0A3A4AYC6_9ACTN|nr:endonuclease/exonuclease/phosphatase family protein [Bailinhaonella thermotolerans]RJL26608.1 endonuclease/exonuclease/phosphatase family protein [Bailinhaonella thermotolerans]
MPRPLAVVLAVVISLTPVPASGEGPGGDPGDGPGRRAEPAVAARVAGGRLADAPPMRVMSFNIRFAEDAPAWRAWSRRRPLVVEAVRRGAPDLAGLQEVLWRQVRDLERALPEYGWVGQGRAGGRKEEFNPIFYRRDRFVLRDSGHYWLSPTPERTGSKGWGNFYVRMVTWARFEDRRTGRPFHAVNTHFDHQSARARERSAALVARRVADLPFGLPVVVTGDFNAPAGASRPYDILTGGGLADTWETAERRGTPYNTYGDWKGPVRGGERIDWILTGGDAATRWAEISTFHRARRYPSDHYPVLADVVLGESR